MHQVPGWHSTHHILPCHCLFSGFFPMSVNSRRAATVPSSIAPVFLNACRAFRPLQMLNMYHWITEWQERKANWPEQGNDALGLRYQGEWREGKGKNIIRAQALSLISSLTLNKSLNLRTHVLSREKEKVGLAAFIKSLPCLCSLIFFCLQDCPRFISTHILTCL